MCKKLLHPFPSRDHFLDEEMNVQTNNKDYDWFSHTKYPNIESSSRLHMVGLSRFWKTDPELWLVTPRYTLPCILCCWNGFFTWATTRWWSLKYTLINSITSLFTTLWFITSFYVFWKGFFFTWLDCKGGFSSFFSCACVFTFILQIRKMAVVNVDKWQSFTENNTTKYICGLYYGL